MAKEIPTASVKLDAEQRRQIAVFKLQEIRQKAQEAILYCIDKGTEEGMTPETMVVVVAHIEEPWLTEETRRAMMDRGDEIGVFPAKRAHFCDGMSRYQDGDGNFPYKNLMQSMLQPPPAGSYWVATFWKRMYDATDVRVEVKPITPVAPSAP